jgi:hypothetical protein
MRAAIIFTTVLLTFAGSTFAQEYVEFKSQEDRFSVVFPAQPKITETTYTSEFKSVLPARVYSVDQGQSHFKVTVVDYNNIQAIATEKAKACPPGAEACSGNTGAASSTGAGYWKPDIEGAVIHATWELMQRPNEKPIYLGWTNMNLVEGHMVNLVNEKDKSRTSAAIYMHENKLYIIEGTVPAGYPVPDFFQQSVGWLDEKGNDIRYLTIYHNGFRSQRCAPRVVVRTAPAATRAVEDGGINDDTSEGCRRSRSHATCWSKPRDERRRTATAARAGRPATGWRRSSR